MITLILWKATDRQTAEKLLSWYSKNGTSLELQDRAAKKGSGRVIPVHPELRAALVKLAHLTLPTDGPVIRSERGGPMTPVSVICWFARAFRAVGLEGCSSHSGRRTFITRAARLHRMGIKLTRETASSGDIGVYFGPGVTQEEQVIFANYIHAHLANRSEEVQRLRYYVCPHCGTSKGNPQVL